jgi:hypothetical protein
MCIVGSSSYVLSKFSFWFVCPLVRVSRNEERTFLQAKIRVDDTNVLF